MGQGCSGVPQTLACHPGSTQPGGTATDAGSRPTAGQKVASSQKALLPPGPKSQTHTGPPNHSILTELLTIFSSKGCQLTSRTQALWLVSFFTMWPLRRSYTVQERPEWRGAARRPSSHPSPLSEQHHLPASQTASHFPRGAKPMPEDGVSFFSLPQVEGMV